MRRVALGVDSGTQSTKVLVVDAEDGRSIALGRAAHSGRDTQHPDEWWAALRGAVSEALARAGPVEPVGIAVAGQQHGCVLLDAAGGVVRPAPLWNNLDAAPDAARLNGLADFPAAIGLGLVASITIAKLAHLSRTEPASMARAAAVCLPHDWLTWRLTGRFVTDRGEASGSGWWSPASGEERRDLLALAVGAEKAAALRLPRVLGPDEAAGTLTAEAATALGLPAGIVVGAGTGDNMAGALGLGAELGEVVVSLGTSGTAFLRATAPSHDARGEVCGFADAAGGFLPLVCLVNCTRVVDGVADLLGLDREEALRRAAALPPGGEGILMLPLLGGERTPNLPAATGQVRGLTNANLRPDTLLRAALDGVAANLAYAVERLRADAAVDVNVDIDVLTAVGGGAVAPTWRAALADATGLPVQRPAGDEHAARGAAVQAAAVARGEPVGALAARWRPDLLECTTPRPEYRAAFRLAERRAIIAELSASR